MITHIQSIDSELMTDMPALCVSLKAAAQLLLDGECVAFPTETVYGLGGLALSPAALHKIFTAKGRPLDNPLIAHVADLDGLKALTQALSPLQEALIRHFSPGPITYVLPKRPELPAELTAGLPSVAVRIPAHPVARALAAATGQAIAAPSANLSGRPSPTTAEHVRQDLAGKIPLILDAGPCVWGLESTVLDLCDPKRPRILRPGAVAAEELEAFLAERSDFVPAKADWRAALKRPVETLGINETPPAPGMKYRHYAPAAPVYILSEASLAEHLASLREALAALQAVERLGLYASKELCAHLEEALGEEWARVDCIRFSSQKDGALAARGLFSALRKLDKKNTAGIWVEALHEKALGLAYMNRLRKASSAGGAYLPEAQLLDKEV